MTISIDLLYLLVGFVLVATAVLTLLDRSNPRRLPSALFWGLYGTIFLIGQHLPPEWVGACVIAMALIAGMRGVGGGQHAQPTLAEQLHRAKRLGHRLFVPALTIPVLTMVLTLSASRLVLHGVPLLDPKNTTMVSLGLGCVLAFVLACRLTHETPLQGLRESHRFTDTLGWASLLPQVLAILGLVFSEAGVGKAVAHVTTSFIDMDMRFVAVSVYVLGMALFTIIMGNGFAAFPVMTGGVGVPILVGVFHGNPAIMAAIGMFSGYSGTLITPMAANFNIVPAALLELPDKYAVIRAQLPTALALLVVNIFLLDTLMFL